jgi:hypothetical protein
MIAADTMPTKLSDKPRNIERRLERLALAIDPATWAYSMRWYERELDWLRELGRETGRDPIRLCYGFAAWSPRMSYAGNRTQIQKQARGEPVRGLRRSRQQAIAALRYGRLPRGQKVNRFGRNLAGDLDAVTVDIWMMRAAGFTNESASTRQYALIENAVQKVAAKLGCTPRDLQAAIWHHVRGGVPSAPAKPGAKDLQSDSTPAIMGETASRPIRRKRQKG